LATWIVAFSWGNGVFGKVEPARHHKRNNEIVALLPLHSPTAPFWGLRYAAATPSSDHPPLCCSHHPTATLSLSTLSALTSAGTQRVPALVSALCLPRFPDSYRLVSEGTENGGGMPAAKLPEFRRRAVGLAREGLKPVVQIAKVLGISGSGLRRWVAQADVDVG